MWSTSSDHKKRHGTRTRTRPAGRSLKPEQSYPKCRGWEYQWRVGRDQENTPAVGSAIRRPVLAARRTFDSSGHLSGEFHLSFASALIATGPNRPDRALNVPPLLLFFPQFTPEVGLDGSPQLWNPRVNHWGTLSCSSFEGWAL